MHLLVCVIPIELNFHQFFSVGVNFDVVIFLESVGQVVQVVLCKVFNAKVVDDQNKLRWTCLVLPKGRDKGAFAVPFLVETLFEFVVAVRACYLVLTCRIHLLPLWSNFLCLGSRSN